MAFYSIFDFMDFCTSYLSNYYYVSIPNHTSRASSTTGNWVLTASERVESEGNHVSSSSSSDREKAPYPWTTDSNGESAFRGAAPIIPWYQQRLNQGNLWCQRSSEAEEPGRTSVGGSLSRSNTNRQSLRSFLFNGNAEQNVGSKKTKEEVAPVTPLMVPPPRDERSISRNSSLSSILPSCPYDDNVFNGTPRSHSPAAKLHRSRSTSETSDVAVIGVRERVIELQHRSATASPSAATKQHFPPLSLIPQLRQRKSELTVDWLERLEGQLKQYMESSCREYNVILRWILSCGSRQEDSYAATSLQTSVEDLVSHLTARDAINGSRDVLPFQPLRGDDYFNPNEMHLHRTSSDWKTYRPSIRKWRYGVRDRNSTVSSASGKSVRWAFPNIATVVEYSQVTSSPVESKHLSGGRARKVVVVGDTVDIPIIFYPISYRKYQRGCSIISAGSADALAFATLLYLLEKEFGIIEGMATLMTGYSSNQRIVDGPNSNEWRLGRGAAQSIIPYNLNRVLHTISQSMPDMAEKISITGCSVPVDSGSAIDFTCRLSHPVASVSELADILRESNTLKTLEVIHTKCQPGWLLSQWCPKIPELNKSDLPKVDCTADPNTINRFNAQKILDSTAEEEVCLEAKRETKISRLTAPEPLPQKSVELASGVVHFWQNEDNCCVGRDILSSDCMMTLDVHSCLLIPDGSLIKLIAWYDRDMSFCKRILDLLVYMRHVDHS
uniref:Glyceraldehyde 3-phosphate dehydrogenase catalytic domain-containing protein n=1 Tax=Echinococcus canadensis TaxID=519352 RepID=A0A915EY71_9CEST